MSSTRKTFIESLRVLCTDEVRLRELELLSPVDELVRVMLDTLGELPGGSLLRQE